MSEVAENTGAALAAEPAPAQAEAAQSSPTPTDGAAPAQPTAYQRKKQREREAAELAAKRKAQREARKAAKAGKSAPAAKDEPAETQEEWDEAQRAREAGGFWRLTLRLVSLCMLPFGYRLDALTKAECDEDVALLAPLAGRHKWLEVLIRYAALPYLLVERVVTKTRKREPPKDATKP